MIRIVKGLFLCSLAVMLCLATGCNESSSDDSGNNSGDAMGTYAGTWTGTVCGRSLTMKISQKGNQISGTYSLSDPAFSESFTGSVDNITPPASADLMGGGDRMFAITFNSYNSLSGGYYKSGEKVCDVKATK
ncbi:hypothetical protein P3T73_08645 [Kiritimatiellota bacterium B12222]|nr:hypothetical protein P3T73_08645 [Kiritimatiellota bacterium B12222]